MRKIEEVGSLELIFVFAPCRAGKNVENIRDGFGQPSRGATSRVILKYGSYERKKNNRYDKCYWLRKSIPLTKTLNMELN